MYDPHEHAGYWAGRIRKNGKVVTGFICDKRLQPLLSNFGWLKNLQNGRHYVNLTESQQSWLGLPPRGKGPVKAHELIFRVTRGYWPYEGMSIDHIDGDRFNNRSDNLRLATARLQALNGKRSSGCYQDKTGKWIAQINDETGRQNRLGAFDTETEARAAYDARWQIEYDKEVEKCQRIEAGLEPPPESLPRGVVQRGERFRAHLDVTIGGKKRTRNLGTYDTLAEAEAAARNARHAYKVGGVSDFSKLKTYGLRAAQAVAGTLIPGGAA